MTKRSTAALDAALARVPDRRQTRDAVFLVSYEDERGTRRESRVKASTAEAARKLLETSEPGARNVKTLQRVADKSSAVDAALARVPRRGYGLRTGLDAVLARRTRQEGARDDTEYRGYTLKEAPGRFKTHTAVYKDGRRLWVGSEARAKEYIDKKISEGSEDSRDAGGARVVHNKLLGGWYVVTGPHQTPLNGRFDSKEEAEAWLRGRGSGNKDATVPGTREDERKQRATLASLRSEYAVGGLSPEKLATLRRLEKLYGAEQDKFAAVDAALARVPDRRGTHDADLDDYVGKTVMIERPLPSGKKARLRCRVVRVVGGKLELKIQTPGMYEGGYQTVSPGELING